MAPALATEQIDKAAGYLSETRDALLAATSGLTPSQWTFKPDPLRWSIAEIVEHVVTVECRIQKIVRSLGNGAETSGADQLKHDEFIMTEIPRRITRIEAPLPLHPTGNLSGEHGIRQFLEAREQTIRLASTPSLRDHVFPHPIFGPWDGYQWLLAAGGHGARHTEQILEVRSACVTSS